MPVLPLQPPRPADPNRILHVTLMLRPRSGERKRLLQCLRMARQLPAERRYLTIDELIGEHGADEKDLRMVLAFAKRNGMTARPDRDRCSVVLSGPVSVMNKVFSVRTLVSCKGDARFFTHRGKAHIPPKLKGVAVAVAGLDTRPLSRPLAIALREAHQKPSEPERVAEYYKFPPAADKSTETIGIIAPGGGFHESDLKAYFSKRGMRKPEVTVVSSHGYHNKPASPEEIREFLKAAETTGKVDPGSPAALTIETTMDIELAGAFGGVGHIVVYMATDDARGIQAAIAAALSDRKNRPSVISCSWGNFENKYSRSFIRAVDGLLETAILQGVAVCCASGDAGDGRSEGSRGVYFPASSRWVLACGGTHLLLEGDIERESPWHERVAGLDFAGGYGASRVFATPSWQRGVGIIEKVRRHGRAIPDVAGKADLKTGYVAHVGGTDVPLGGTSAAAPMWAGLLARIGHELGVRPGWIAPLLYHPDFRGTTRGITGKGIRTRKVWDPKTGWGSPIGKALCEALAAKPDSHS